MNSIIGLKSYIWFIPGPGNDSHLNSKSKDFKYIIINHSDIENNQLVIIDIPSMLKILGLGFTGVKCL